MRVFIQDARYAVRRLLSRPGLTAIIVFSIGLGIGANTLIFSFVNGFLLEGMPYPNPDRFVAVWFTPPNNPAGFSGATHANCAALRERVRSFEYIGCAQTSWPTNMSEDGPGAPAPERLVGQQFSAELPEAIGINPVIGRWFTLDEERRADPVILISNRLWQRRFGGTNDVLGKQIRATNQSLTSDIVTIIGVMPPNFDFLNPDADYWIPWITPLGSEASPSRRLMVAGRLAPGVTLPQAQSEMDAIAIGLSEEVPQTNEGWGIRVEPIEETISSQFGSPFLVLQGVVAFVLLIACANVAGLLLAKSASEGKEIAIRSALGSGRWRVVRQLLTESTVIALAGGVFALAVAWSGLRILLASLPTSIPRINQVGLDPTVLTFTLLLSVVTGIVFGLVPAIQASRTATVDVLKASSRSNTASASRQRLRGAFVVLQVSLAMVLLVGAGLMINSFIRVNSQDVGVDTDGLMTLGVRFDTRDFIYETGETTASGSAETGFTPRLFATGHEIWNRLQAIPGAVSASGMVGLPPLSGGAWAFPIEIAGRQVADSEEETQTAQWFPVFPRYFETLDVPVVRGREFNAQDTESALPVILINATIAQRYWPGEDPIGQQIQVTGVLTDKPRQIVGVVGNIRQNIRQDDQQSQVYIPFAQLPRGMPATTGRFMDIFIYVVRAQGDPGALAPSMRQAVAQVEPDQPIFDMQPLEQYLANQNQGVRQYVQLLGIFAAIALVLAIVGIYGVMSHSVGSRLGEIGVRMALGATRSQVLGLVLRRGMLLTGAGLVVGIGGSLALTRIIANFLFGISPTDPLTFALVILILASIALAACYIPARRASKVDPMTALRHE